MSCRRMPKRVVPVDTIIVSVRCTIVHQPSLSSLTFTRLAVSHSECTDQGQQSLHIDTSSRRTFLRIRTRNHIVLILVFSNTSWIVMQTCISYASLDKSDIKRSHSVILRVCYFDMMYICNRFRYFLSCKPFTIAFAKLLELDYSKKNNIPTKIHF
jgi:hypothetical protein